MSNVGLPAPVPTDSIASPWERFHVFKNTKTEPQMGLSKL